MGDLPATQQTRAPVLAGEFSRTVAFPSATPSELPAGLTELTAEVFAVCLDRFPGKKSYRHRLEKDRGLVEGHRFHVERQGFRGVVSIQWYARAHSYRQARDGGLEVRIGGQARLLPVWSAPGLPELDAQVHGRVLGVGVSAILGVAGVQGVLLMLSNPSFFPAIDVVGIAIAVLMIFAAVYFARQAMSGAWWHRRPRMLCAPDVGHYGPDLTRWRALGVDLSQLTAATTEPER